MQPASTSPPYKPVPRRRNGGFTLVELVIVIVVLGVLGSIALPRFVDFSQASKIAATQKGLIYLREQIQLEYLKSATSGATPSYPTPRTLRQLTKRKRPPNPFTPLGENGVRIQRISNNTPSARIGVGGWAYDPRSGEIWANTFSGANEHEL